MFELLARHLKAEDDPALWEAVVTHILAELPAKENVLVRIGPCSHWLRPHQTRWTADGGFAWPSGYGLGTGGFSREGLPEFDWSITCAWNGKRWYRPRNKSGPMSLRIAIPSRTRRHQQAAIHTLWGVESERERRFYGFRRKAGGWQCTAETEWDEDAGEKKRRRAPERPSVQIRHRHPK